MQTRGITRGTVPPVQLKLRYIQDLSFLNRSPWFLAELGGWLAKLLNHHPLLPEHMAAYLIYKRIY
jgi:hypothetical protein